MNEFEARALVSRVIRGIHDSSLPSDRAGQLLRPIRSDRLNDGLVNHCIDQYVMQCQERIRVEKNRIADIEAVRKIYFDPK